MPGMEMLQPPLYDVHEPGDQAIVNWRLECFEAAGMELAAAAALAIRRDIDRARVEVLLARGATSAQVCEMLL